MKGVYLQREEIAGYKNQVPDYVDFLLVIPVSESINVNLQSGSLRLPII